MHSLIPHVSPAMASLLLLMLMAMMPWGEEARCSLKKLDGDLKRILGPFSKDNYVTAAEKFVETLGE
jgi:hypothetical protein